MNDPWVDLAVQRNVAPDNSGSADRLHREHVAFLVLEQREARAAAATCRDVVQVHEERRDAARGVRRELDTAVVKHWGGALDESIYERTDTSARVLCRPKRSPTP